MTWAVKQLKLLSKLSNLLRKNSGGIKSITDFPRIGEIILKQQDMPLKFFQYQKNVIITIIIIIIITIIIILLSLTKRRQVDS